jgi:hypothetical protein
MQQFAAFFFHLVAFPLIALVVVVLARDYPLLQHSLHLLPKLFVR